MKRSAVPIGNAALVLCGILLNTTVMLWSSGRAHSQPADTPERLELTEVFRVGEETEENTILFGRILDIAVNSAGQLFVADWTSESVNVFADTGELVDRIGSRGEGPGEFTRAFSVAIAPGDSVAVFDAQSERLSLFEPISHRFAYSASIEGDDFSRPSKIIGFTDKGMLIQYTAPYWAPGSGTGLALDADRFAVVNLVNRRGAVLGEPVMSLPSSESIVWTDGSGMSVFPMPFGRENTFRLSASGQLYSGWSETIDIALSTTDGEVQRSIRHQHQALPVTNRDIDAYLVGRSRSARKIIRETDLHKTMPAYGTFVVDDMERVWVKITADQDASTAMWSILNAASAVVAEAVLPSSVDLYAIKAGRAYGSGKAASGDPYVVAYRISE